MEIIQKVPLETGFHYVTVHPEKREVFVSNNGSDSIQKFIDDDWEFSFRIEIFQPRQIIVNRKANSLLIASKNFGNPYASTWIWSPPMLDYGSQINLMDLDRNSVIGTLRGAISGLDFDEEKNLIYLSQKINNSVFTIDAVSLRIKKKIQSKEIPIYLAYDQKNKILFSANYSNDSISLFDMEKNNFLFSYRLPNPSKILTNPKMNLVYVLQRDVGDNLDVAFPTLGYEQDTIYCIDAMPDKIKNVFPQRETIDKWIPSGRGYMDFAIDPKTGNLFVVNTHTRYLYKLDPYLKVTKTLKLPKMKYPSISVDSNSHQIYIASGTYWNNWLFVIKDG